MYVCNCNGLRKRDIDQAIQEGARRPKEVFLNLGCDAQCSKCVKEIIEQIRTR